MRALIPISQICRSAHSNTSQGVPRSAKVQPRAWPVCTRRYVLAKEKVTENEAKIMKDVSPPFLTQTLCLRTCCCQCHSGWPVP